MRANHVHSHFAGEGARATRVWEPFDFAQGKLRSSPA